MAAGATEVKTDEDEAAIGAFEAEVIATFVSAAQLLGLPRSIGEIYGLLYLAPEPLPMDQIVRRLRISTGSASQGLKVLRGLKAVRTTYVPGQRKDFFVAETELRRLTTGFFKEEVHPRLDATTGRLESLHPLLDDVPPEHREHYRRRLEKLESWHKKGSGLLRRILGVIRF